MTSNKATSILRLVGILAIFVGLAWTTITYFQTLAAKSTASDMFAMQMAGGISDLERYAYFATISISLWGCLLYGVSSFFGRMIAKE